MRVKILRERVVLVGVRGWIVSRPQRGEEGMVRIVVSEWMRMDGGCCGASGAGFNEGKNKVKKDGRMLC